MAQYALPNANSGSTSWTQCTGDGDADWFDELDEGFGAGRGSGSGPDDTTSSWASPSAPTGQVISTALSSVTDPGVNTAHIVRARNRKFNSSCTAGDNSGQQIDVTIRLLQGVTQIATATFTLGSSYTTRTINLSTSEADSITNYSNLIIETSAAKVGGGSGRSAVETAHEFECPDASTPLTVTVSDSNATNWTDLIFGLGLGFVLNLAENALNLSDTLTTLGHGHLLTDNLSSWNERQDLGYGLQLFDDTNVFADAVSSELGVIYFIEISDDLNLWNDAVITNVLGFLSVDASDNAANLSDDLSQLGTGHLFIDDLAGWLDRQDLDHGLLFTDDLNVWLDSQLLEHGLIFTDNLDSWLDSIVQINLGFYNFNFADDLNGFLDDISIQLGGTAFDIPIAVADNLNTLCFQEDAFQQDTFQISSWTDQVLISYIGVLNASVADDLNTLLDIITINLVEGLEILISITGDTLSFNDNLTTIGTGHLFEDLLTLSDDINFALGYLQDLVDNLNNWTDISNLSLAAPLEGTASDNLQNWSDQIHLFSAYLTNISDNLDSWLDQIQTFQTHDLLVSDTLDNLVDSIRTVQGLLISFVDNLSNWNDLSKIELGKLIQLTDDLSNWNDIVNLQVNIFFSSDISKILTDTLNFWQDQTLASLIIRKDQIRDYLRRYLNDVVTPDAVVFVVTPLHGVVKPELHSYIRRYLNDTSNEFLAHPMDSLFYWRDAVEAVRN